MRRMIKFAGVLLILELLAGMVIFAPVQAAVIAPITISPTAGPTQTTVTVSGTSGATDAITVNFDTTPLATVNAVAGVWTTAIVVPAATAGNHTITAVATGSTAVGATFNVTSRISLSRTTGTTGNTVTVTGTGFAATSNITITFNSVLAVTGTSDTTGSFSINFTVPAAATGTYNVVATDSSSFTATASFSNTVTPAITITKTSGTSGTSVTVNGTGFAANEANVQVTIGSNPVGSVTQASASGVWSVTFTVPAMPAGSAPIGAFGATTAVSSVTTQAFNVLPNFTISKATGVPGISVTVNGTGFAASEPNIKITWDTADIGTPISADAKGSWSASFNIPVAPAGAHNVAAYGPTTVASSINPVPFTIGPSMTTSKANGTIGTQVTVNGTGFAASEANIVVTFDGTTVASTNADQTGVWTTSFTVPVSFGGTHAIGAKGAVTAASSVTPMGFVTLPTISSNKTSGTANASITITGSGFAASENNIVITYDDAPVVSGINADANGSWTATFNLPTSSAGTHTIKANGPVTHVSSSGNASIKVASTIALSQPTGYIGMKVTVTGTGFAASSALTFWYDGNQIGTIQTKTDENGNFTQDITIPKSLAGSRAIKVTDASNNTVSTNFVVESTPPLVPNPISPADGTKQGLTGNITPEFKWTTVTDPSGVTYNLQIDTDSAFPHPILEKDGLTVAHYTLTQSEALPKGQYFWRVQAVDGASNTSEWSQPMTINSGVISSGMLVLFIILGIIVIVALLVFLVIMPLTKKKKVVPAAAPAAPASAPEIVIPEMVNAEYRTVEADDPTKRKALPWRLALPQATQPAKGGKTFTPEEQARLKVAIDFAKAMPLMECGNNTDWLIELAESDNGNSPVPELYAQLLKGDIQVRYQPAWVRHPTFNDLQDLLEGQSVLQDLNSFIDSVNRTAAEATQLLRNIYKDTTTELNGDLLDNNGWGFISGVYNDSVSWFLSKYLREPSDRDYSIKAGTDTTVGLYGAANTPFEGLLAQAPGEKEAALLRMLHLKLRRSYRNSDKSKQMASLLTQLEVQRSRLLNAFSQLSRLNP